MDIRSVSWTRTEFRETLGALGLAQDRVAQLFGVGPRSVRRWRDGTRRVPHGVDIVLRLLAGGAVTIEQVERAAVPTPARTNGGADPGPLPPPPVPPAPEQSALQVAALANPGLTVAEKVLALAPGTCRWPCGNLHSPNFHFCSHPVTKGPHCEHHHVVAYMAAPTRASRSPITWQRLTLPSHSLPARQGRIR